MSGGQHRSFITKVNGVICAQPLHNGQTFTKIILDTNTREMSYELIDVSSLKDAINESLEKIFTDIQIDLKEINIDISEIIMNYLQKKQQIKLIDESNYVVKY